MQNSKKVDSNVVASAATTVGMGRAEQMMNCLKPQFVDDGRGEVTGLKEYASEVEGKSDRGRPIQDD